MSAERLKEVDEQIEQTVKDMWVVSGKMDRARTDFHKDCLRKELRALSKELRSLEWKRECFRWG